MRRRILMIMISLILAFPTTFVMMGCGGEPVYDRYGRVRILMGLWPSASEMAATEGLRELFEARRASFEARFPEYVIVPRPFRYDVGAISAQARAGTLPTIFQTYFTEPSRLIRNNWVRPITAQLDELGWTDYMHPQLRAGLTSDNQIFGVPRDGYALGLLANLNLLWASGSGVIDRDSVTGDFILYDHQGNPLYPTTFDELRQASQMVTETHDTARGLTVLATNHQGGWQFSNIAWNFGLESFQYQANNRWNARLNAPEARAAAEWIHGMSRDNLLVPGAHHYGLWPGHINQNHSAMAFVGSDAITNSVREGGTGALPMEYIGFFPMPAVEGVNARALTGGVPFMFCRRATDRQVMGALRFLEHMGLAPMDSEIMRANITAGLTVADAAGHPIVPTFIPPWTNEAYLAMLTEIESQFINVNIANFQSFMDRLDGMMQMEEPHMAQDMYRELDAVIRAAVTHSSPNIQQLLNTAQNNFTNTLNRDVNNRR